MINEYMHKGYVRSNCLSKVAHLFDGKEITQFAIARSRQEKRKIAETKYSWLSYDLIGKGKFCINWDSWKDNEPWLTVMKELIKHKDKGNFIDFVVEKIEVGFDDDNLITLINKHLLENNDTKPIPKGTIIYVTFTNKPIAYDIINGWDAKIVNQVNLEAIRTLKFKRGVLDVAHISTHHNQSNKQLVNLDFLTDNKKIVWNILHQLKTDRWFKSPEIKRLSAENSVDPPRPGAIRTYERKSSSKWSFVGEEEVN